MRTVKLQILASDFFDGMGRSSVIQAAICPITKALNRAGYSNIYHQGLQLSTEQPPFVRIKSSNINQLWRKVANMDLNPESFEFDLQLDDYESIVEEKEQYQMPPITFIS